MPSPSRKESAEQLRRDIDRGLTGDKIPVQDPAAAPLGTDDEAAGMPPTSEEIRDARRREAIGRPPDTELARGPATSDPRLPQTLRPIYAIAFLFALIFVVVLILALWSLA
ncbi:hypothetical protein ACFW16_25935 [Inquilinus sp. NPDC058860]|uniref:hypothetical protein n=1 Tax=Inquilinus sp. NPDC058860 TaxID=3346652 RepID=UPI0036B3BA04